MLVGPKGVGNERWLPEDPLMERRVWNFFARKFECDAWEVAGNPRLLFRDKVIATEPRILSIIRQLDPRWKWFDKKCKKFGPQDLEHVLWFTIVVHLCDRASTFEKLGIPQIEECHSWLKKAEEFVREGNVFFADIHQTIGWNRYKEALTYSYDNYDNILAEIKRCRSGQEICDTLGQIPGMGSYNKYQVMDYLVERIPLPYDPHKFALLGPGALYGLEWAYGRKFNQTTGLECIKEFWYPRQFYWIEKFDISIPKPFTELDLKAWEHAFCEFRRYMNAKYNRFKGSK